MLYSLMSVVVDETINDKQSMIKAVYHRIDCHGHHGAEHDVEDNGYYNKYLKIFKLY